MFGRHPFYHPMDQMHHMGMGHPYKDLFITGNAVQMTATWKKGVAECQTFFGQSYKRNVRDIPGDNQSLISDIHEKIRTSHGIYLHEEKGVSRYDKNTGNLHIYTGENVWNPFKIRCTKTESQVLVQRVKNADEDFIKMFNEAIEKAFHKDAEKTFSRGIMAIDVQYVMIEKLMKKMTEMEQEIKDLNWRLTRRPSHEDL